MKQTRMGEERGKYVAAIRRAWMERSLCSVVVGAVSRLQKRHFHSIARGCDPMRARMQYVIRASSFIGAEKGCGRGRGGRERGLTAWLKRRFRSVYFVTFQHVQEGRLSCIIQPQEQNLCILRTQPCANQSIRIRQARQRQRKVGMKLSSENDAYHNVPGSRTAKACPRMPLS